MLRIRNVYPESRIRIFHPESRIRIFSSWIEGKQESGSATKNLNIFTLKLLLSSWKYDTRCLSRIRPDFFHPRSWGQKSRPDPDPQHCLKVSNIPALRSHSFYLPGYNQQNYFIFTKDKEDVEALFNCTLTYNSCS
jgi:hypothetical protein